MIIVYYLYTVHNGPLRARRVESNREIDSDVQIELKVFSANGAAAAANARCNATLMALHYTASRRLSHSLEDCSALRHPRRAVRPSSVAAPSAAVVHQHRRSTPLTRPHRGPAAEATVLAEPGPLISQRPRTNDQPEKKLESPHYRDHFTLSRLSACCTVLLHRT